MTAKEFYKSYLADDNSSPLSAVLATHIFRDNPSHVLEFGCGTGKNLDGFNRSNTPTIGIDISFLNVCKAKLKYDLPCVICSDETYLRNIVNVDVVFTVSVLDHIFDIKDIIEEFKRIANKSVYLAETRDEVDKYYYYHNYEEYGFEKVNELMIDETNEGEIYTEGGVFSWIGNDKAEYFIWKWVKS